MMTIKEIEHAARVLLRTKQLTGGDDPRYLPKVFVVAGHTYMYLNAARRAAYGTKHAIYVLTIEQAFNILPKEAGIPFRKAKVSNNFDQTGDTFNGRLFDERNSPLAEMVNIPIVPLVQ